MKTLGSFGGGEDQGFSFVVASWSCLLGIHIVRSRGNWTDGSGNQREVQAGAVSVGVISTMIVSKSIILDENSKGGV